MRASPSTRSARLPRSTSFALSAALLAVCACTGSTPTTPTPPTQPGTPSNPPVSNGTVRGIAVAVGLNSVDPNHYGGWSGPLTGCEPDARDMQRIAQTARLDSKQLLTRDATRQRVLGEISTAAQQLGSGDLFVLSYSGHGGQIPDMNGDDPDDHLDETWCLFDGELLDDELYGALGAFKPGVRVFVLSDSCHSGTVLREPDFKGAPAERDAAIDADWSRSESRALRAAPAPDQTKVTVRAMPPKTAIRTYRQNQAFYDELGAAAPKNAREAVKCQALLIAGCEDDQLSSDLGTNGLFTLELVRVWNNGAFSGGHPAFQQAIRAKVLANNPDQAPAYFKVGPEIARYEAQRPYTLALP